MSNSAKNPLDKFEDLLWGIGRMFVLYFYTFFFLFYKPSRVIPDSTPEGNDTRSAFCPPVTFFVLSLAFLIATGKYVFYQQAFDLISSIEIFTTFLTKGPNISDILIVLWAIALAVPLCALILIVALMRLPTKSLLISGVRFLLYYYSVALIVMLLLFGVLVGFDISDPISQLGIGLWLILTFLVGVNFARVTKLLFARPYWAGLITLILSQNVLPTIAVNVFTELPQRWSFETKLDKATVAGIIKVHQIMEQDTPIMYSGYSFDSVIFPEWKTIFKGKGKLEKMSPERRWISVVTLMRGQNILLKQNACYFVFLEIYKERLIPLRGSPTGFYEIDVDNKRTMIPLGHVSFFPMEQKLVTAESIPLSDMLNKIEPQFDYERFNNEILSTCNQPINE